MLQLNLKFGGISSAFHVKSAIRIITESMNLPSSLELKKQRDSWDNIIPKINTEAAQQMAEKEVDEDTSNHIHICSPRGFTLSLSGQHGRSKKLMYDYSYLISIFC